MNDAELIRAIQAGSQAALEDLYRRYLTTVWRYAYARIRRDREAVEDVVSETFVAAIRAVGRIDPDGGSVSGWLLGICRHKLADHHRWRSRAPRALNSEHDWADDLADDARHEPSAIAARAELCSAVAAALDELSDDERQTLEWKYLDGDSVRTIAARLGRTEKAVESILYRARGSFRTAHENNTTTPTTAPAGGMNDGERP